MSCRCRRRRELEEEVESARDICREREEVESETESLCNSDCFLIVWRDRNGRRRCKCCRGGCRS
ncbi:MAG: hypothetical protein K0R19_489 [Bacillota bacterium]|jgi:hypothetical protein|nr:hypothetical protein [Bacillota bacterium]